MASVFKRAGKNIYYIAYHDAKGRKRIRSAHTTDRAAAEELAAKSEYQSHLDSLSTPDAAEATKDAAKPWESWQLELLRTQPPGRVAQWTGRKLHSVYEQLNVLGIREPIYSSETDDELPQVTAYSDLAEVINAWPTLQPNFRTAFTMMVRALRKTERPETAEQSQPATAAVGQAEVVECNEGPFATPLPEADFNRIVADTRTVLYYKAWQLLGDGNEAEDVVQQALLRYWNYRQSKPCRKSERGLLFRILKSKVAKREDRRTIVADVDADATSGKAYFDARKA